jgi:hypothetical protein
MHAKCCMAVYHKIPTHSVYRVYGVRHKYGNSTKQYDVMSNNIQVEGLRFTGHYKQRYLSMLYSR